MGNLPTESCDSIPNPPNLRLNALPIPPAHVACPRSRKSPINPDVRRRPSATFTAPPITGSHGIAAVSEIGNSLLPGGGASRSTQIQANAHLFLQRLFVPAPKSRSICVVPKQPANAGLTIPPRRSARNTPTHAIPCRTQHQTPIIRDKNVAAATAAAKTATKDKTPTAVHKAKAIKDRPAKAPASRIVALANAAYPIRSS